MTTPAFTAYAIASLILSLNLLLLWFASGVMRAKSGVAINPEDGAYYKMQVAELDPPEVARFLRAHRNAEATTYPFLLLGLIYVLAGGTTSLAAPLFAIFVLARLAHSIAYARGLQPWRMICFVASLLALLVLMAAIVRILAA